MQKSWSATHRRQRCDSRTRQASEEFRVERVIFPETEMAQQLADRLTWPSVIDFLPIDSEYSFVEIAMPESLCGKKLVESDLRRRFGVWVVGVKDALTGKLTMFPDGDFTLAEDQMVLLVGREKTSRSSAIRCRGQTSTWLAFNPSKIDQANSENWDVFDRLFRIRMPRLISIPFNTH